MLQTLSFSKEILFPWFDNVIANSLNQKLPNLQNTEWKKATLELLQLTEEMQKQPDYDLDLIVKSGKTSVLHWNHIPDIVKSYCIHITVILLASHRDQ